MSPAFATLPPPPPPPGPMPPGPLGVELGATKPAPPPPTDLVTAIAVITDLQSRVTALEQQITINTAHMHALDAWTSLLQAMLTSWQSDLQASERAVWHTHGG